MSVTSANTDIDRFLTNTYDVTDSDGIVEYYEDFTKVQYYMSLLGIMTESDSVKCTLYSLNGLPESIYVSSADSLGEIDTVPMASKGWDGMSYYLDGNTLNFVYRVKGATPYDTIGYIYLQVGKLHK
jgi:hypothetical protein